MCGTTNYSFHYNRKTEGKSQVFSDSDYEVTRSYLAVLLLLGVLENNLLLHFACNNPNFLV